MALLGDLLRVNRSEVFERDEHTNVIVILTEWLETPEILTLVSSMYLRDAYDRAKNIIDTKPVIGKVPEENYWLTSIKTNETHVRIDLITDVNEEYPPHLEKGSGIESEKDNQDLEGDFPKIVGERETGKTFSLIGALKLAKGNGDNPTLITENKRLVGHWIDNYNLTIGDICTTPIEVKELSGPFYVDNYDELSDEMKEQIDPDQIALATKNIDKGE